MDKIINGFTNYTISTEGVIKVISSGLIRKTFISHNGYELVDLYKNNKRKKFLVHRLVAEAFIENPNDKEFVNHIDGVKTNNIVSNLEWVTKSENMIHAIETGLVTVKDKNLNEDQLTECLDALTLGSTITELAETFSVGLSRLSINMRIHANNTGRIKEFILALDTQRANRLSIGYGKTPVAQLDADTKEVIKTFDSITEAAKELDCGTGGISNVIKGRAKTAKGYSWELLSLNDYPERE